MKRKQDESASRSLEGWPARSSKDSYVLRLYVTGATVRSIRAVTNIRRICQQHLLGRYHLEVVDILQRPHLAGREQIYALPTLVKSRPLPHRRVIGDLSDTKRVLLGLDLKPTALAGDGQR